MSSEALASLTATYTDSEGEEDMEETHQTSEKVDQGSQSAPESPKKAAEPEKSASAPVTPKRTGLVSYVDDTIVSDDVSLSPSTDNQDDIRTLSMEVDTDEIMPRSDFEDSKDGVTIPREPSRNCPKELQDNIAKFYKRVLNEGIDMNKIIQDRKNFRNPSMYEKLIQFCDINELDTNYPPEIYDPSKWGKESYYDELARAQKVEMDRREKEKKEKLSKTEFISGIPKKPESNDEKKRKSKWDQPESNIVSHGHVPLTSNVTGTKGTVISAFGSLPKKPKA